MNKTKEEYLKMPYMRGLIGDGEEGYLASIRELSGCITCGDTKEEAMSELEDAFSVWLEAALEDVGNIPLPRAEGKNVIYTSVGNTVRGHVATEIREGYWYLLETQKFVNKMVIDADGTHFSDFQKAVSALD